MRIFDNAIKNQSLRRRGFTIIELVIVMGASSILLLLATTTIVRMQALSRSNDQRVASLLTFVDLGRQFREDVHRADAATIDDQTLTLQSDGQLIHYQYVDGRLGRQVDDEFTTHAPLFGYQPTWDRENALIRLTLLPIEDKASPKRVYAAALGLLANGSRSGESLPESEGQE